MLEVQKIVVVEDDLIIRMFITNTLRMMGFTISGEARSSDKALAVVEETEPDLILMDIGITGSTDGIETAHLIRQRFSIPVIFLTGNSDQATITRAQETSPLSIIFKPIDDSGLKRQLLEVCKLKD